MASSSSDGGDEIKDLLTCSLCSRTLNEPRCLPCFHNFCKVCLGKYVVRLRGDDKTVEIFPCPSCRSDFTLKSNQDVADFTSIHFIKNMLEIMAIQEKAKTTIPCSRCQESAINYCTTCEVFMCKKCSESHNFWPKNKNDNVLSLEELSNTESQVTMRRKLYCIKHDDKILEYYCETCKELCCIDCVVLNHQKANHSCVPLRQITQKQRETLQSSCTTIDEKLSEGKKALNNICGVMKSFEKNAKNAKDQIKEQKEKILKIVAEKLDEKVKKLNNELDEVYGEMRRELSKQHDKIKEYLEKVQASVSLPRNLLKRGSVEEIISSQKLIDQKIEKLENEKPEDMDAVNDGDIQYLPDDIGKVNVDEIVGKLGHVEGIAVPVNVRKSSSILKEEIALMKQLQKWLGGKCEWNLCYRASRDGWSAQDFHRHCDKKGPTVVLVKANDCIFGGYTDQHWESLGCADYKRSNSSFLFSLRNKDNLAPFIANIKQGREDHAIICNRGGGPTFGEGPSDLYICNNPQTCQSHCNFGHTYQLPPGYVYGNEPAKNLLAGQYKILPTEIEVFN